jgi:serine/threonine protein kinase
MSDERARREKWPERVGPWVVIDKLGGGGNAWVYKAKKDGTTECVALKVLKSQKPVREPYLRFIREAEFLRGSSIEDGILPLIDASVPDKPTRDDPAWVAMPIAQPIRDAVAGAPLETVIDAVATIAETLASLAEKGIAHRDIKPGNLYRLHDRWLVGDFGLVDIPDLEQLTREGRPLGPAHFTAYELIANPDSVDARPADVYSLAKTLWVLATGQNFPPEGHQSASTTGYGISDLRPHRHAAKLDELIDSMTLLAPEGRPSMAQVARDLRSWLRLGVERPGLNLDDIRAKIRARLQPQLTELDIRSRWERQAEEAIGHIRTLIGPLNDELESIHPKPVLNRGYEEELNGLLIPRQTLSTDRTIFTRYTASWVEVGYGPSPLQLKYGCGVALDEAGNLSIRTAMISGYKGIMGDAFFRPTAVRSAPVGSIESEEDMQAAIDEGCGSSEVMHCEAF